MKRFTSYVGVLQLLLSLQHIHLVSSAPTYEHAALQAADQCDWIGSGGGGRGVRPVYLRCSRGTVLWKYPRGALRVVLSPPVLIETIPKIHVEFVAGRDSNDNNNVDESIINNSRNIPRLSGFRACTKVSGPVRVYLETHGKLRSLYTPRDGKHEASHRCFYVADKQPAALYMEAEEQPMSVERRDVKLQYDLELRRVADGREEKSCRHDEKKEEEEDCRPCSIEELAKAYCQSDLVARGTVSAVQKQPNLEAAELIVGITKTLRQIEENEVRIGAQSIS
ncbi:Meteorin-like protein [Dufourea novaeangliae]|uniref:Meteorin-like protein n=1 Tax=Dufourea novaeangliae TaxID=178035 RepID=A0A154PQX9_DUFNO|nr:Meteorin-like protein [Dufourea novaeangliae]